MKRFNCHFLFTFMLVFVMIISCKGNTASIKKKENSEEEKQKQTLPSPIDVRVVPTDTVGELKVTWETVANNNGYELSYKEDSNESTMPVAKDVTTTTLTSLQGGKEYSVSIKTKGDGTFFEDSPYSQVVKAIPKSNATIEEPAWKKDFVAISLNGKDIVGQKIDYELPVDKPDKPEWRGVFVEGRIVRLDDYFIAKYQVTYELWYKVYSWGKQNGYQFANEGREGSIGIDGEAPTDNKTHPVTKVSWRDAIVWCNAYTQMTLETEEQCVYRSKTDSKVLKNATEDGIDNAIADIEKKGFRLPTEAEWELAARFSGTGTTEEEKLNATEYGQGIFLTRLHSVSGAKKPAGFSGVKIDGVEVDPKDYDKWTMLKDEALKYAVFGEWFCGDKSYTPQDPVVESTAKVGTKKPNFLGIYDMSGNVWEWVFDGDDDDPTKDDSLYLKDGVVVNPQGKKDVHDKEKRGGSFFYDADSVVVGLRDVEESTYKFDDTGFRLALSKQ